MQLSCVKIGSMKSKLLDLRAHGYRITPARKAMAEIISQQSQPQTAVQIIQQLNSKGLEINKSTVYRELTFFVENGLVKELLFTTGETYYESALLDHHHHLICQQCQNIEEIKCEEVEPSLKLLNKRVEKEKQFIIQQHQLEFFGYCADCQPSYTK